MHWYEWCDQIRPRAIVTISVNSVLIKLDSSNDDMPDIPDDLYFVLNVHNISVFKQKQLKNVFDLHVSKHIRPCSWRSLTCSRSQNSLLNDPYRINSRPVEWSNWLSNERRSYKFTDQSMEGLLHGWKCLSEALGGSVDFTHGHPRRDQILWTSCITEAFSHLWCNREGPNLGTKY